MSSPHEAFCATCSPKRTGSQGRWILGAVLIDPLSASQITYTARVVPEEIVNKWLPKQSYMGQLEILACPLAIATWAETLRNRQIWLFVDNDSAAAGLVRGYSPKVDSCALIGAFWLQASAQKIEVYIDRVESKSNLADGPSRWELHLMHSKYFSPNSNFLYVTTVEWFVTR